MLLYVVAWGLDVCLAVNYGFITQKLESLAALL